MSYHIEYFGYSFVQKMINSHHYYDTGCNIGQILWTPFQSEMAAGSTITSKAQHAAQICIGDCWLCRELFLFSPRWGPVPSLDTKPSNHPSCNGLYQYRWQHRALYVHWFSNRHIWWPGAWWTCCSIVHDQNLFVSGGKVPCPTYSAI